MNTIPLQLPNDFFIKLETAFPCGPKNNATRDRAYHIVKHWLLSHPDTTVADIPLAPGADITFTQAAKVTNAEIKGTEDNDIAWSKLKVSGTPSYNGILSGWPVYRVTAVFTKTPTIYILRHDEDFTFIPEPRWRVQQL